MGGREITELGAIIMKLGEKETVMLTREARIL